MIGAEWPSSTGCCEQFLEGQKLEAAARDVSASYNTVMTWYNRFAQRAEQLYYQDLNQRPLGPGPIQIDESHFFKAKHNVGRQLGMPQLWVFGMIDSNTQRVMVESVTSRDAETLIPMIISATVPNSIIHSDQWAAYNQLGAFGYRHFTVNHTENFVDPITGAHKQRVEGMWGLIKRWLRTRDYRHRSTFDAHLHEWAFRRNVGTTFAPCWTAMTS